jgi:hypothetical protein
MSASFAGSAAITTYVVPAGDQQGGCMLRFYVSADSAAHWRPLVPTDHAPCGLTTILVSVNLDGHWWAAAGGTLYEGSATTGSTSVVPVEIIGGTVQDQIGKWCSLSSDSSGVWVTTGVNCSSVLYEPSHGSTFRAVALPLARLDSNVTGAPVLSAAGTNLVYAIGWTRSDLAAHPTAFGDPQVGVSYNAGHDWYVTSLPCHPSKGWIYGFITGNSDAAAAACLGQATGGVRSLAVVVSNNSGQRWEESCNNGFPTTASREGSCLLQGEPSGFAELNSQNMVMALSGSNVSIADSSDGGKDWRVTSQLEGSGSVEVFGSGGWLWAFAQLRYYAESGALVSRTWIGDSRDGRKWRPVKLPVPD